MRAELAPHALKVSVAGRTLHIAERFATIVEHHKKHTSKDRRISLKIEGRLVVARDVPHEDLGIWLELEPAVAEDPPAPQPPELGPQATRATPAARAARRTGMRRIFGVTPVSLMEPEGLRALAALDRLAHRLRAELAELAGDVRRAVEIGRGLDKVLVTEHGDRFAVYARRLFRDRAHLTMEIYRDGRIVIWDRKGASEIHVHSRFGVTTWGDYVRFADPQGADLAKVSIPWIAPEDRKELARRIGQLVDRDQPA